MPATKVRIDGGEKPGEKRRESPEARGIEAGSKTQKLITNDFPGLVAVAVAVVVPVVVVVGLVVVVVVISPVVVADGVRTQEDVALSCGGKVRLRARSCGFLARARRGAAAAAETQPRRVDARHAGTFVTDPMDEIGFGKRKRVV